MESSIHFGGTIFYSLSLHKNTTLGKDIFYVLDTKEQSVRANNLYLVLENVCQR